MTSLAKKELRKLIKQNLHSATDIPEQSKNVTKILKDLPAFQKALSVACYLHMDQHEIETDLIIQQIFQSGKSLFLPRLVDLPVSQHGVLFKNHKKEMKMLLVESQQEIDSYEPQGPYKLREPPETKKSCFDIDGLDLIIVPGLGFTSKCHRIGHGKGFYDTFIKKCNAWSAEHSRPRPYLVGIGAKEQLVEHIPQEEHDHPLDAVIINDKLFVNE